MPSLLSEAARWVESHPKQSNETAEDLLDLFEWLERPADACRMASVLRESDESKYCWVERRLKREKATLLAQDGDQGQEGFEYWLAKGLRKKKKLDKLYRCFCLQRKLFVQKSPSRVHRSKWRS